MTETFGDLLGAALQRGEVRFSPDVERMVDDLFAQDTKPLTDEQRQRFLAATNKVLAWRRERIMFARCTVWCVAMMLRQYRLEWHSLFECERHGHHPLRATWTGPYCMETSIVDTRGKKDLGAK